ncbi:acyl-CoA thioesterase domain-containing protein [Kribbella sp. NPDC003505]|uniref:thioesterase family protein n=1 Tax=Kribbella sp. NPDC003505 TaxID=3154448 RepID=UPI0033B9A7D3
MRDKSAALYRVLDDRSYEPSDLARSPWGMTQAGGSLAGLAVWHLEGLDCWEDGRRIVRVSAEFLRPTPMVPVELRTSVIHQGRRTRLGQVEVVAADVICARVTTLAIAERAGLADCASHHGGAVPDVGGGWSEPAPSRLDVYGGLFGDGIEVRIPKPEVMAGWGTAWMRPRHELVEGSEMSGTAFAVAVADLANGVVGPEASSTPVVAYQNADLVVSFLRPPSVEWIQVDGGSTWSAAGFSITDATLRTGAGPIARVSHRCVLMQMTGS